MKISTWTGRLCGFQLALAFQCSHLQLSCCFPKYNRGGLEYIAMILNMK